MSDDPRHLPDDYVLRAGWRLKYEGDEDKYVLTSPIGRQFDIPLARLYSAGYKKVLKYGLEARADLAAPACPKCDGRTEGTMGLKPGYEGVRIYNVSEATSNACMSSLTFVHSARAVRLSGRATRW